MRKRIWIPCAVALVVCLLLLLLKPTPRQRAGPSEQSATLTNQPSQTQQPRTTEHPQATNVAQLIATLPPMTPIAEAVARTNPQAAIVIRMWQTPIDFYGKVLDQNSNPVPEVNIHFNWSELPEKGGERDAYTQSDSDGAFSLHGKRGASLTVSVHKERYYSSHRGEMAFNYAFGPDILSPDPKKPVIFSLRKEGVGVQLVAMKQNYRVARDGTPLAIDLATGTTTTGENGNFVVRCWTDDQGKKSGQKYDWRCVLTIPGGGIVLTDDEFAFLAPENGYAPSTEIAMPADRPGWKDQIDLKFFYRLADGRHGRMTFSMIAGGQHFCMIDSVMNPSGSRNLEPAN